MALRDHFFCDTAGYYATAQITEKYTTIPKSSAGASIAVVTNAGREGRPGIRITSPNDSGAPMEYRFTKTLASGDAWLTTAFGFRFTNPQTGQRIVIAQFVDVNTVQVSLCLNQDGTLSVLRGNDRFFPAVDVLDTTSTSLQANTDNHIEWMVKFAPSGAGEVYIWINNGADPASDQPPDLTLTGVTTSETGSSTATSCSWGVSFQNNIHFIQAFTFNYSDVILRDSTDLVLEDDGTTVTILGTEPLGDVVVLCLHAQAGNGDHIDLNPLTGTDHGAMVDELAEDGDTTYNSSQVVGARDTYETEDLPSNLGTVYAVQVVDAARKASPGSARLNGTLRIAHVDYDGETPVSLGTAYAHIRTVLTNAGGAVITPLDVNQSQSGPLIA